MTLVFSTSPNASDQFMDLTIAASMIAVAVDFLQLLVESQFFQIARRRRALDNSTMISDQYKLAMIQRDTIMTVSKVLDKWRPPTYIKYIIILTHLDLEVSKYQLQ